MPAIFSILGIRSKGSVLHLLSQRQSCGICSRQQPLYKQVVRAGTTCMQHASQLIFVDLGAAAIASIFATSSPACESRVLYAWTVDLANQKH